MQKSFKGIPWWGWASAAVLYVGVAGAAVDFAWEREITNRVILPELNAALAPAGTFVDLIDLRWGVTEETW